MKKYFLNVVIFMVAFSLATVVFAAPLFTRYHTPNEPMSYSGKVQKADDREEDADEDSVQDSIILSRTEEQK